MSPDRILPLFKDGRVDEGVRLQKVLAEAGICSRREAERLIAAGRVLVNGRVETTLGLRVRPTDRLTVDGREVTPAAAAYQYYLFYKPAGYLTTRHDPQGRPTIQPFLDRLPARVYPVGRLDLDVEGLLILTNDGELARRLMHPSYQAPKTYRVKVAGRPQKEALEKLRSGTLMIGDKPAAPARAELIKEGDDRAWILLTLTEGRRRQVKRMCSAVGHPVLKLKRIAYGPLKLGDLKRGEIRALTENEAARLRELVGMARPRSPATLEEVQRYG